MDMREIGIIQGMHIMTDWSKPVQICSLDTLIRRPKLPEADVVVFDEVHRNSKVYERWMKERPQSCFIGLSATPWRKGMDKLWDRMIVAETTQNLIDQGYLSKYRLFAPATPDLSDVKIVAGDYHEGQLAEAMNKPKLVADVVTTWLERAENRPTFVFGVDCAHAKALCDQFTQAGVQAAYIDAFTPVEERECFLGNLKDGKLNVICNIGTMTTGVDAPFVSCIVLARATRSEMLYIQIIGRGLRQAEGKKDLLVLDHSGTALRLGFPDEIVYYDFIDGKDAKKAEKKPEQLPKPCPACTYLMPPKTKICPSCGFEKKPTSKILCEDGELVEIDRVSKKKDKGTRDDKQEWWSGLLWIARDRQYKDGWAANKYRERFGVWPRGLDNKIRYPTENIFRFVKKSAYEWRKSKEAKASADQVNIL
jgi:superfamily II DNA or RNA helicase